MPTTINDIRIWARRASPQPLEVKNHGLYSGDVPVVWATVDNKGNASLGLMEDDIALLCNARNWIDQLLFEIEKLQHRETKHIAIQYKWASIINGLSVHILDGICQEAIDLADDSIIMVTPYLGLNEE